MLGEAIAHMERARDIHMHLLRSVKPPLDLGGLTQLENRVADPNTKQCVM